LRSKRNKENTKAALKVIMYYINRKKKVGMIENDDDDIAEDGYE
jgi:hypothetical protein